MELPLAKLEEWMRRYYHAVDHDIGSSGVRDLTVGELCDIADFDLAERMLRAFLHSVHRSRHLARPRMAIAVPTGITMVERRAVEEAGRCQREHAEAVGCDGRASPVRRDGVTTRPALCRCASAAR